MKKIIQYSVLIILIGSVGFSSCKKEKPITAIVTPPPPPPLNYPPFADAGPDQTLNAACFDSSALHGWAYDEDPAGISFLWTQVSGSNQCNILTPDSAKQY